MPKAAKSDENAAPKKKKSLAANKRRRKARNNPAATANPPALADFTGVLLPGFAAYGAVRVLQRIAFSIVGKKWPKAAKHAHAATGVLAFGGIWGLAHKIKKLAPYHDAAVMGSGIAAAQGLVTNYLPVKYRWLLADCDTADLALPAATNPGVMAPQVLPTSGVDDEYAYLEDQLQQLEMGGSRQPRTVAAPKGKPSVSSTLNMATAGQDDGAMLDPDLMDELGDENLDDLYSGAFEN